VLLHLTRKERDDKCDLNQLRTEPWIPNQDERRVSKMLWSIVSKATVVNYSLSGPHRLRRCVCAASVTGSHSNEEKG